MSIQFYKFFSFQYIDEFSKMSFDFNISEIMKSSGQIPRFVTDKGFGSRHSEIMDDFCRLAELS